MPYKLLIIAFLTFGFAASEDLNSARAYFQNSKDNQATAEKLQSLTQNQTSAVLKAYNGASFAILAKHQGNPYKKLEFLKKGLGIINSAVLLDADEIEIRYVRFAIEENIPNFVSFTSHIESDKKMLIGNLNSSHSHYKIIKAYLMKSKKISEADKKKIQ